MQTVLGEMASWLHAEVSLPTGEQISLTTRALETRSFKAYRFGPAGATEAQDCMRERTQERGLRVGEREAHPGVRHTYRPGERLRTSWQALEKRDYPPMWLSVARVRLVARERGPAGVKVNSRRELNRSRLCTH